MNETLACACHPDCMGLNSLSRLPDSGWQQRLLPVVAGLASEDARVSALRAHGSASGRASAADRWADRDVLVTATEAIEAAERLARRIGDRVAPVFAASRNGSASGYCVRLVLADLRRIDISAVPPSDGTGQALEPGQHQEPSEAVAEMLADFRFEAVLAAVKAARGHVLIGAQLTLPPAPHALPLPLLLPAPG